MNMRTCAEKVAVLLGARRRIARIKRVIRTILIATPLVFGMPLAAFSEDALIGPMSVVISTEFASLTAAEWVQFDTAVTNSGTTVTPPLAAHLSIAGLEQGQHVDPEDWSPERTQFLPALAAGETVHLTWWVHALFDGDFAAYVTVVPTQGSFPAASSKPLRLQVEPDDILPLEKVIPVVAAVPFVPLVLLIYVLLRSHRSSRRNA